MTNVHLVKVGNKVIVKTTDLRTALNAMGGKVGPKLLTIPASNAAR